MAIATLGAAARAGHEVVALSGQAAPGGGTFASFRAADLSLGNSAVFRAAVDDAGGTGAAGIYRFDLLDAGLDVLARTGQTAPGAGGAFADFGSPVTNFAGHTAFRATLGGAGGAGNGIYFTNHTTPLTELARDATPLDDPIMSPSGHVAFSALGDAGRRIYAAAPGATAAPVAQSGPAVLAGGVGSVQFNTLSAPKSLAGARVAFMAQVDGTGATGVYETRDGGATFVEHARTGTPAPGGGTFATLGDPAIAGAASVAFTGTVPTNSPRLWRGGGSAGLTLVASGGPLLNNYNRFGQATFSGNGDVYFDGTQHISTATRKGIVRNSGTPQQNETIEEVSAPVDRLSSAAPDPDSKMFAYRGVSSTGGAVHWAAGAGGSGLSLVGYPIAGSRTAGGDANLDGARGGRVPVNKYGQFLYWARLDDGREGVFLYTPELSWWADFGGAFNDPRNWHPGIAPGPVHDVRIRARSLPQLVNDNGQPVHVRSLAVGEGTVGVTLSSASAVTVRQTLTVHAGSSLAGGTLTAGRVVNDGTVRFNHGSLGPVDGAGTLSVRGSVTSDRVRQGALVVESGASMTVRPNGTPEQTSRVRILSVGPLFTKLDITDNDVVLDYVDGSPLVGVASAVREGRLVSSVAAADARYAVGFARASDVFPGFPATWSGQEVDATTMLIGATRRGDANMDGVVNLQDFNRLAAHFGQNLAFWWQGDFNHDWAVNLQDFNLLAANFGLSAAGSEVTPQDWAHLGAAVPEPAGAVVSVGILACLTRRRAPRRSPSARSCGPATTSPQF